MNMKQNATPMSIDINCHCHIIDYSTVEGANYSDCHMTLINSTKTV